MLDSPTRIVADVPDDGLAVLTPAQRDAYVRDGFLVLERFVAGAWLERLRAVTAEFVDLSRDPAAHRLFDLDPAHTAEAPRLRRLHSPVDRHDLYWEFATAGPVADLVADLLGPDLKFHHGKLNFKARRGGEEVRWHQDIGFWPHTNYGPLTVGLYLEDVTDEMGPVGFVPASHDGPLYDHHDPDDPDRWAGCLSESDARRAGVERAVYAPGPAGTVTVHNCRIVHGSAPNTSDRDRPLLLQTYSPADAFTYTDTVRASPHGDVLFRGQPARWARHDPRPCLVSRARATSLFQSQHDRAR